MKVLKLSREDAERWDKLGSEIFLGEVVLEANEPEAQMSIGFSRATKGAELEISFEYDELLVTTKGVQTVRTADGEVLRAAEGEAIYLPAGSKNTYIVEEDNEGMFIVVPASAYTTRIANSRATGRRHQVAA